MNGIAPLKQPINAPYSHGFIRLLEGGEVDLSHDHDEDGGDGILVKGEIDTIWPKCDMNLDGNEEEEGEEGKEEKGCKQEREIVYVSVLRWAHIHTHTFTRSCMK